MQQTPNHSNAYKEQSAMIFIDNKYTEIYYQIIDRARSRKIDNDTFSEKHHIIPESFYKKRKRKGAIGWLDSNPDDLTNLVLLSAREHFVCHLLLIRMTQGDAKRKMSFAIVKMIGNTKTKGVKINSHTYEYIRKTLSTSVSGTNNHMYGIRGSNHHSFGKPRPEHVIQAIKDSRKRKGNPFSNFSEDQINQLKELHRISAIENWKVRDKTVHANKIRDLWSNRSNEDRAAISEKISQTLKNKSPEKRLETLKKVRESRAKWEPLVCPHCGKTSMSRPNMARYHFDQCLTII